MTSSTAPPARAGRRAIHTVVESVERLTPHLMRVVVGGEDLEGFGAGAYTDHYVKLQDPRRRAPATLRPSTSRRCHAAHPRDQWPRTRTYTVRDGAGDQPADDRLRRPRRRRRRRAVGRGGPAWRRAPAVGPRRRVHARPRRRLAPARGRSSVTPAIAASLLRIPSGVPVHVIVEVDGPEDEIELDDARRPAPHLAAHRRPRDRRARRAVARSTSRPAPSTPSSTARPRPCARSAGTCSSTAVCREAMSVSGYWKRTRTEEGWREDKAEWNRLAELDAA